ncbi:hypothetical protein [Streptococcus porci]|uniref:hypothetical protein n=1 Tax=Streptococcus porci TaxID=502567 RepID=UPI0004006EC6|nr:hypothetical protein [Streptococcus porci]
MKKVSLIGLALLSVATLVACSGGSTSSSQPKKVEETTVATETTKAEEKTFAVGEKIIFEGVAEVTITKVEWTDERNQFESTFVKNTPEKVLKVTYDVNNLSDKDYVLGGGMDLYVAGKKMETYPNSNTIDTVSAGRSFEGAIEHFGVIGSGDMELEIEPSFTFGNTKPAIVKLDIK